MHKAFNGKQGLLLAKEIKPDLILLDIMMPEVDGIEVCRELRAIPEFSQTLIAFLTARNEDFTQVQGFEVGADDYISKPVKPRILTSRIKALLRRKINVLEENGIQVFGDLKFDREKYLVYKNNIPINLAKRI